MLTQEQLAQYRLDGYVLVSGLISEETIANAEAAMWFTLGMNRDDPTSWSPFPEETDGLTTNVNLGLIEHFGLQTPALLACCTPAFYEVQDQLTQKNPGAFHCQNPQPEAVWTRSVFPVSSDWNYFNGHVDWWISTFQCLSWIIPCFLPNLSRFWCYARWWNCDLAMVTPETQSGGNAVP